MRLDTNPVAPAMYVATVASAGVRALLKLQSGGHSAAERGGLERTAEASLTALDAFAATGSITAWEG